jgi:hypothetical protein
LVPIASFLAGSLLSLLLPTLLLIALVVWYVRFIGRSPGPAEVSQPTTPPAPGPAESGPPDAAPTSKQV